MDSDGNSTSSVEDDADCYDTALCGGADVDELFYGHLGQALTAPETLARLCALTAPPDAVDEGTAEPAAERARCDDGRAQSEPPDHDVDDVGDVQAQSEPDDDARHMATTPSSVTDVAVPSEQVVTSKWDVASSSEEDCPAPTSSPAIAPLDVAPQEPSTDEPVRKRLKVAEWEVETSDEDEATSGAIAHVDATVAVSEAAASSNQFSTLFAEVATRPPPVPTLSRMPRIYLGTDVWLMPLLDFLD